MQELFQAIPGFLSGIESDDTVVAAFVYAAWRKTAGEQLRQWTEPLEFRQKRLTLAVENAIWKRHLQDLSGEMLFKLNALLGQGVVNFIEFRIDPATVLASSDRKPPIALVDASRSSVTPELKKAAMRIADPELRENFLDAASAYLLRQKQ